MQRVKRSTAVATLPLPPAGGTPGYFAQPNPAGGVAATVPGYEWFNAVQEELLGVIEGQSLVASGTDNTQLRQAIQKMLIAAQRAVVIDQAVFAPAVVTANAVYWDTVNSRFDQALADGTAKQNAVGFADVTNSKVYAFGDAVLFSSLTPGPYYLSGTMAGAITQTAPANTLFVGTAKTATEMFVDIDQRPAASSPAVQGAFRNLAASASGISANVIVTADEIILEDGSNNYKTLRAVNLTVNASTVGANGLDTGTLAASTWYALWIVAKSDGTTAGLLSTSATAPTMPSGYTYKARVGWVRTDATVNKYPFGFKQFGRRIQYLIASGSNVLNMPIIASGVQGSDTTPTWVSAAWANFAPSTATYLRLNLNCPTSGTHAIAAPNNSYGGNGNSSNPPPLAVGNGGSIVTFSNVVADIAVESANVYYASGGSGATLSIMGWEDNL